MTAAEIGALKTGQPVFTVKEPAGLA